MPNQPTGAGDVLTAALQAAQVLIAPGQPRTRSKPTGTGNVTEHEKQRRVLALESQYRQIEGDLHRVMGMAWRRWCALGDLAAQIKPLIPAGQLTVWTDDHTIGGYSQFKRYLDFFEALGPYLDSYPDVAIPIDVAQLLAQKGTPLTVREAVFQGRISPDDRVAVRKALGKSPRAGRERDAVSTIVNAIARSDSAPSAREFKRAIELWENAEEVADWCLDTADELRRAAGHFVK